MGKSEDLVRVAGGDDQALSELYDRYCGQYMPRESGSWETLIWRRSLYRTPSPTFGGEAESFKSERASFSTWLYRITRNRAVDLDRKRRVRPLSVREDPLQVLPRSGARGGC